MSDAEASRAERTAHRVPALWRWGLPLGFFVAVWVMIASLHADPMGGPPGIAPVESAEFTPEEGGAPTRVSLPHEWWPSERDRLHGTYVIRFDVAAPLDEDWALFVPGLNTRATVRLDERLVPGRAEAESGLASRFWLVPLYRRLQVEWLSAGEHVLELVIGADDPGTGLMGLAYVGPDELLRPSYEARRFLQVSGIQILVIAMVSLGFFLAGLTALRRRDTSYLWFAVVLWVFAFGFWNLLAIESRIPKPPYQWVGAVTMSWLVAAITVFSHRLLGERHPRREGVLGGAALLGSLYFWVTLGTQAFHAAVPIWGTMVLAASLIPAVTVARRHVSAPSVETSAMVAGGLVVFSTGCHDVALVNGAFGPGHDFAIQHGAWTSVALFALIFVKRFVDALNTSEALTAELSERVRQKAAELEAGHARLRVLEREQAVNAERERILAELHDGLGSQLGSTLALVREGKGDVEETAAAIQSALDDMRLMIDSLDDVDGDLGTLLGSLRQRIGRRLERGGISLRWQIQDTPTPAGFGPEAGLHVLRIAQEAMTNILKHARASTITVSTFARGEGQERRVILEIIDDGCGFGAAEGPAGRGVDHMKRRASRIGAELKIESAATGTRVRLDMPAPAAARA